MNAYISDALAREHTDALLADAAAGRRAKQARRSRRAASISTRNGATGPALRRAARSAPASAAHFVTAPFVAFREWFAAGQL